MTTRRARLIDQAYHQTSELAERLVELENTIAALDDDHLSTSLWSLQQACLRLDRDLRERRA